VAETDSESHPVAGFGINSVEPLVLLPEV